MARRTRATVSYVYYGDRRLADGTWKSMQLADQDEQAYLAAYREGCLGAQKRILLMQLRLRFETLPPEMEQVIEATQDTDKLDEWLCCIVTAKDLDSFGILPPR